MISSTGTDKHTPFALVLIPTSLDISSIIFFRSSSGTIFSIISLSDSMLKPKIFFGIMFESSRPFKTVPPTPPIFFAIDMTFSKYPSATIVITK